MILCKKVYLVFVLVFVIVFHSVSCLALGEDFVDNNTSDIDSISDKGTHSNFENEKAYDSSFDMLTEEDAGSAGSDEEDDIDNNTSDIDGSPDKGVETDFVNAQGSQLDGVCMNIQEENTGGEAVDEWKDCNSYDSAYTNWTKVGTTPYLDADDSSEIYTKSTDVWDGWYDFADTAATGTGFSVNVSILCYQEGAGESIEIVLDYLGGSGSSIGSITPDTSYSYKTIVLGGTYSASEINQMRIYVIYHKVGKGDLVHADYARLGISRSGGTNYEIDLEYQWTDANYTRDFEFVCIYVESQIGSEALNINYYSTGWNSLGSITSTGWTNVTATGLDSSTYTIQLIGALESADSSQDDWNIDLITLHTYTLPIVNYELNLEVQWEETDFDESTEELRIATGSFSGSENLEVYEWNISSSQWVLVDVLGAGTWNNFSISCLTSINYTIKFQGTTESEDTTQDTWNIDASLIYTFSESITTTTTTSTTTTTTTTTSNPPAKSSNPQTTTEDPPIYFLSDKNSGIRRASVAICVLLSVYDVIRRITRKGR